MTKSRSKLEEQLSINFLSAIFKFNEGHILRDKFLFGGWGFKKGVKNSIQFVSNIYRFRMKTQIYFQVNKEVN